MKRSSNSQAAFTLADAMVACGLGTLVGLIGYAILNTSTILYAKITSINLAHDESRIAVNRLVGDIHKAVSTPQLWDGKGEGGNGLINFTEKNDPTKVKASCVSFQMVPTDAGPYEVKNDPGNPELIMIGATKPGFKATVGMRLIIPMYKIENTLTKVTSNGSNHWNVWMANGEERIPKSKKDTKVICYFTVRNFYAVENGELRAYLSGQNGNDIISTSLGSGNKLLFKNSNGTAAKWVTIARNITSSDPFNVPNYPDRRYVGVNLTTEDSTYSKRGFKATNTLIAGSIPFRARLCEVQ